MALLNPFNFRKLIIVYGFVAAAFAAKMDVQIQGTLRDPFGGFGPTFLITYQIDQFPSPSVSTPAFFVAPITATLKSGSLKITESASVAYFAYFDGLSSVGIFFPASLLEFSLRFPDFEPAYAPPAANPEILETKKTVLAGVIFPFDPDPVTGSTRISVEEGVYEARLLRTPGPEVPEPATAATLAAGILGLSLLRHRFRTSR
jgi:hypothetical protein